MRKIWSYPIKTTLAAVMLAALITACGEGGSTVSTNKPAESAATELQPIKPDELSQEWLEGKFTDIHARFSDEFKKQVSEAEFVTIAEEFTKDIQLFEEASAMQLNGGIQRTWVSDTGAKGLSVVFDDQDVIVGLQVKELTKWPETDQMLTKTIYNLPFKGEWLVFWGGTNTLVNYHYEYESQRYAYDFVQSKEGFSFTGDPLKNESYYAFGQPLLAPADGTVVSVVNDIPDNVPVGVMNEKAPAGNIVVIDHGGEFSMLAHLKQGSVTVNVGDKVTRGDEIGQLGNSGNSSELHLHYQVSDGADLFESRSINVNWVGGVTPVQGELIIAE